MSNGITGDRDADAINENTSLTHSNESASLSNYDATQKPELATPPGGFRKHIRAIGQNVKLVLGAMTVTIAGLLLYHLLAQTETRDHCVRRGYKTSTLPPTQFSTGSFALFLPGHASAGIIKLTQLPPDNPSDGSIQATVHTFPGNLVAEIHYNFDVDEKETRVTVSSPSLYELKGCVYIEIQVQVPSYTESLYIMATDNVEIEANSPLLVGFVKMSTMHAPIRFLHGWQGNDIMLGTIGVDFNFSGNQSLHAARSIDLHTTGSVQLDDSSSGDIRVYAFHNRVEMRNVTATGSIEPITINGMVYLQDTRAYNITVDAKHTGTITLDHVTVDNALIAETENGAIQAQLDKSQNISAMFKTHAGDVNITMPDDFAGRFAVYSSSTADVTIVGDDVVLEKNLTWKKTGYTKEHGQGSVRVRALYSHVKLVF